jgi:hypothetical protein
MCRFYVTGGWSTRDIFLESMRQMVWNKPTHECRKIWPLDSEESHYSENRSLVHVGGIFTSQVVVKLEEQSSPELMRIIERRRIPLSYCIWMNVRCLWLWIFTSNQFADRYLPMLLAYLALIRGGCYGGFNATYGKLFKSVNIDVSKRPPKQS